jgi:hypothetical protein
MATIYRRWMSSSGALADLMKQLTPLQTPLPNTGHIHRDLAQVASPVSHTLVAPMTRAGRRVTDGPIHPLMRRCATYGV